MLQRLACVDYLSGTCPGALLALQSILRASDQLEFSYPELLKFELP